jgi:hypothetical protein
MGNLGNPAYNLKPNDPEIYSQFANNPNNQYEPNSNINYPNQNHNPLLYAGVSGSLVATGMTQMGSCTAKPCYNEGVGF